MKCDYCGCGIDGEPMRLFARDLNGNEIIIMDISLCQNGVNDDTDCTDDWFSELRSCAAKIRNPLEVDDCLR